MYNITGGLNNFFVWTLKEYKYLVKIFKSRKFGVIN